MTKPIAWAVVDKDGVQVHWLPEKFWFFGTIMNRGAHDNAEVVAQFDRDYAGCAPHRIIELTERRPEWERAVEELIAAADNSSINDYRIDAALARLKELQE